MKIHQVEQNISVNERVPGTEGYTGLDRRVGEGFNFDDEGYILNNENYNSPFTVKQLAFSMAVSGIEGSIEDFIKEQKLEGLRIVDLGSGRFPSYARVARAMGAEVYTVDVIGTDEMVYDPAYLDSSSRNTEEQYHIKQDLGKKINLPLADIITTCHLETYESDIDTKYMEELLSKNRNFVKRLFSKLPDKKEKIRAPDNIKEKVLPFIKEGRYFFDALEFGAYHKKINGELKKYLSEV